MQFMETEMTSRYFFSMKTRKAVSKGNARQQGDGEEAVQCSSLSTVFQIC